MNEEYFIEEEVLNDDRLVNKQTKTQTLNSFKELIKDLSSKTTDKNNIAILIAMDKIIDDAYRLDMYTFQFKIFSLSLQKEIKNIKEIIEK